MSAALSDVLLGSEMLDATAVFSPSGNYTLWIDRVGAYLVCLGELVTIGGPAAREPSADVSLLANLSRRHASILRSGERYVLHAHSPATVGGKAVLEKADLCDGAEVTLGTSVRWKFRLPSVVSGSARIEFLSDHRPARAADGVVLMNDTCLMGASAENHIRCPSWQFSLLLFRRNAELWIKGRDDLFLDGRHAPSGGALASGSVVTASEVRFRVERQS